MNIYINIMKIFVPKDLYVQIFSIMAGVNETKTLVKHILCYFKCKFMVKK